MKITEVANKLNISARTIRFYEEKGLLFPHKQEHNLYRTFTEQDIWRLQTIISLREAGMSLADIQQALLQIDANHHDELHYYLELQRAVMMSHWVEIKQVLETTDRMITLVKSQQTLPIEDIYQLANASKKMKEQRKQWKDKWNFDQLALTHDAIVADNSGNYADYESTLNLIVQWVAPGIGEYGLDMGTGTGNLAVKFSLQGAHMSGVDQSKGMLRQCQQKYPNLETRLGNFLTIPYVGEQFDFVVSSFAFHHLTDDQQQLALEEIRRVLKPHGRICIADLMVTDVLMNEQTDERIDKQGTEHLDEYSNIHTLLYPNVSRLIQWFENHGYIINHRQVNSLLHVIYAVPIRS
ncbi:putative AdoMet-dependent methyltransferase [Paenibacillus sp. DS2015]|uniref:MerR family transcriptional regulator n=1 Tax=Paenibacillus sp. DS2015 TaxID=3373917 RepID=UPI003D1E004E